MAPRVNKESAFSYEYVSSRLSYDSESGNLTWIKSGRGTCRAGSVAGSKSNGYIAISLMGTTVMAHRIAWILTHGVWPDGDIDHADGCRSNNRISNLRPCSRSENMQNLSKCRSYKGRAPSSKYVGVHWHERSMGWQSRIKLNGNRIFLGTFKTEEEAANAYKEAKLSLHEFNPVERAK